MHFSSAQIVAWVGDFLWPFLRIGMMLTVMPIFGGRLVPARVRAVLALAVTIVLLPVIPAAPAVDPLSPVGVLVTVQQLLIGLAMGFMLQLVFSALLIGGQTIAMSMGLGFAAMVDPQNGVQVPVIGQYFTVVATLLFLALDGHLVMIAVLADSFHALPVANIAFGVITRAAPQLNIFGVGFPMTLTLGFVVMMFALPSLMPQFTRLFDDAMALLTRLGAGG